MDENKVVAMIVAFCDKNKGFGYQTNLPWPYIKKDHEHYRNICKSTINPGMKNGILKGRHCWETMPNEDRIDPKTSYVIVSTTMSIEGMPKQCRAVVPNYEEGMTNLLNGVRSGELENICILGGKTIYECAIDDPHVTHLYITRIFYDFPVDIHFPEFEHRFHLVSTSELHKDNDIPFQFETWERNA